MDTGQPWHRKPRNLPGSDLWRGDLGVSGRTSKSETLAQEIDGTEALSFLLDDDFTADAFEFLVHKFHANDGRSKYDEAGRVTFLEDGTIVASEVFDAGTGRYYSFHGLPEFDEAIFEAGAYNDAGDFVHGALTDGEWRKDGIESGYLIDVVAIYGQEIV